MTPTRSRNARDLPLPVWLGTGKLMILDIEKTLFTITDGRSRWTKTAIGSIERGPGWDYVATDYPLRPKYSPVVPLHPSFRP
jgi:hypothetical protein